MGGAPGTGVPRIYSDVHGRLNLSVGGVEDDFRGYFWDGEDWQASPADFSRIEILGKGNSSEQVLARRQTYRGEPSDVRVLDIRTGEWSEPMFSVPGYDFVGSFYRDPEAGRLVGVRFQQSHPRVLWFEEDYAALQSKLDELFPGRFALIVSADDQNNELVVRVEGDRAAPEYFHLNIAEPRLTPLTASRPWLDPQRMRPVNVLSFTTSEGQKLDAYLTLPARRADRGAPPLIVIPPSRYGEREVWGFDAVAQLWASRGYAVLRTNLRSSRGYRWQFPEHDLLAWEKQVDDLKQAVNHVVESGLVDPDRIALMGESSGGFLAMASLVQAPDFYRCAVVTGGIFEWDVVSHLFQGGDGSRTRDVFALLSSVNSDKAEEIQSEQLLAKLDTVTAPVMIIYGGRDGPALRKQSQKLSRALRHLGKNRRIWTMRQRSLSLTALEDQVERFQKMERFLAQYL